MKAWGLRLRARADAVTLFRHRRGEAPRERPAAAAACDSSCSSSRAWAPASFDGSRRRLTGHGADGYPHRHWVVACLVCHGRWGVGGLPGGVRGVRGGGGGWQELLPKLGMGTFGPAMQQWSPDTIPPAGQARPSERRPALPTTHPPHPARNLDPPTPPWPSK